MDLDSGSGSIGPYFWQHNNSIDESDYKLSRLLTLGLLGGGWLPPPPRFLRNSNLLQMNCNYAPLGTCRGSISAHFEVLITMVAPTLQKLYPVCSRYPLEKSENSSYPLTVY